MNGTTGNRTQEVDRTGFYLFKKLAEAGTDISQLDTLAAWHKEFLKFDKDKNGYVNNSELKAAYSAVGLELEDSELKEMISEVDLDGNGEIDFLEFVVLMKERQSQ